MYKNFEGSELYCYACEHTWDVDNLNLMQTCPECKATPKNDDDTCCLGYNPFITCKCGTRIYLDCNENECLDCCTKYNQDGESIKQKIIVGRPINGISLNGDDYLLDDYNNVMKFDNIQAAKDFLLDNHILADQLDQLNYVEADENE